MPHNFANFGIGTLAQSHRAKLVATQVHAARERRTWISALSGSARWASTWRDAIDRLTALGAQAAGSPRAIAGEVETVMASLPTPDIVLAVATGPDGVIEGKRV